MQRVARRNLNVVMILVGVLAGMTGLTFAAVPLYRLFCAHTGFDGTPLRGDAADVPKQTVNRTVTVSFSGDTNVDLPWRFYPKQRNLEVRVGEPSMAYFIAENMSKQTVTGTATFNVSPEPWGPYFVKIQCFCFTKQTLKPGERVEMPVTFYIDPGVMKDHLLDRISDVTLSYTFFKAADQTPEATVGEAEAPVQPTKLN